MLAVDGHPSIEVGESAATNPERYQQMIAQPEF
jgi:hypothetical protein